MPPKFPLNPKYPERICWGCDKFCSVQALQCGNGSARTQHPAEYFGPDWYDWSPESRAEADGHDPAAVPDPSLSAPPVD